MLTPSRRAVPACLAMLLAFAAACSEQRPDAAPAPAAPEASTVQAGYVGAPVCAECHETQWQSFRGSHHDLALQRAAADTVLADFRNGARAPDLTEPAFAANDQGFFIAPDGNTDALKVLYTFGVSPLQQYVVEAQPGRLQVLPFPWDSRPAEDGGQRWYGLYPGEFPPGDPMHWQGRANSWNGMCADCHSTGVEKLYDPATRTYRTTYQEEDVACEACHGPGTLHVDAARAGRPVAGLLADVTTQASQINACAPCHSRRGQLKEGFRPQSDYFDHYEPALLRAGLYHDDGQILDEVYVYGSFLQSRMHLEGVTCTDCHDPHSAGLKLSGNAVCTQCHNPAGRDGFPTLEPGRYDAPSHHLHEPDGPGSACVDCHMPAATYMGVDVRHDHSFRLPRPDLSDSLGVPNTCNSCHQQETAVWAAGVVAAKFGDRPPHYGETFAAARRGDPAAEPQLAALAADAQVPVMVRANAVALLGAYNRGYTLDALRSAARAEPLLRLGATEGAAGLSPANQWRLLAQLLDDEHLAVRTAAFRALLPLAADPAYGQRLAPHVDAYRDALRVSLDFPETQLNLANVHVAFGDTAAAEAALDEALALQPNYVPALLNLADLYRATLRDGSAAPLLERAMATAPESPDPTFGYALWLTRQQRAPEALEFYERAARLAPGQLRYGYALALALNETGQGAAAVAKLEELLDDHPDDQDLLFTLVTMLRDQGRYREALPHLDRLIERNPGDQRLRQLRGALEQAPA